MLKIPASVIVALLITACSRPVKVQGVKAAPARVEATVSSVNSGTVKAEQLAELAFGAVGRVSRLNVRVGDAVKQGEVLAELENEDLLSALKNAEVEADRQTALLKTGAASRYVYDQAMNAREGAQIAYQKTLIHAPFDGLIAELNLEVGQLSQITAVLPKPLIRIVDLQPRYVEAELDEVDLPKVRVGMPARVKVLAVRREPFDAEVRKIVPFVSSLREQDRTSEFELNVRNEGGLLPVGASADVEVLIDAREARVAVPARAVLGRGENKYVFAARAGRAVKTHVRLGLFNYDRVEILEGIDSGDMVLLPGETAELVDGLKVEADALAWP